MTSKYISAFIFCMSFCLFFCPYNLNAQSEILDDPGFELWDGTVLDSNASNWTEVGTAGSIDRYTGDVRSGSVSVRLKDPTASYAGRGVRSDAVSVTPGTTYDVGVYGYLRNEGGAAENSQLWVSVEWYDGTMTLLSENPGSGTSFSAFSTWELFSTNSIIAPATAAFAQVYIRALETINSNNDIYIDDAFLSEHETLITASFSNMPEATLLTGTNETPVLAFTYNEILQGLSLTGISIKNSGTITAADMDQLKIYIDLGTNGYPDGSDIYQTDLIWDGFDSWTNNSLNITNGSSVLITLNILSNAFTNRTMKAVLPANGLEASDGTTGPSVNFTNFYKQSAFTVPDIYPPVFNESLISSTGTNNQVISFSWSAAVDSEGNNPITYKIYVRDASGVYSTPFTSTTNSNISITLSPGTYYIMIQASDSLGNESSYTRDFSVSIEENSGLDDIYFFPNPVFGSPGNESSRLVQFNNFPDNALFRVFTVKGDLIIETKEPAFILPEHLSSGVYYIIVSSGSEQKIRNLVYIVTE